MNEWMKNKLWWLSCSSWETGDFPLLPIFNSPNSKQLSVVSPDNFFIISFQHLSINNNNIILYGYDDMFFHSFIKYQTNKTKKKLIVTELYLNCIKLKCKKRRECKRECNKTKKLEQYFCFSNDDNAGEKQNKKKHQSISGK